ncbi:MAG TPA: ATP-binding cassette domain-containing protein [Candidatus Binatia bacterium]|nr:ATP-binding cassette domain-containing protein [Candidatus Binatia bacterium]
MAQTTAIEAHGVGKAFGSTQALASLDLEVERATVLALLGPNGAGKTTTVRVLATLLRPDRGRARVAGYDVVTQRHEVRRRISLTGQEIAIDDLQTGSENLTVLGQLRGLPARAARSRAAELLEGFGLTDAAHRRVSGYSGGMRRRLDLAAALISRPEVLFLDEPTTGLDPTSRRAMWAVVRDLAKAGVTILLTTQNLEEADELADRVAVMDHGRIVATGTSKELKARVGEHRLDLELADPAAFEVVASRLGERAVHVDRSALTVGVAVDSDAAGLRSLLDEVDPERSHVTRFETRSASLDDVFEALTGLPQPAPVEPGSAGHLAFARPGRDGIAAESLNV